MGPTPRVRASHDGCRGVLVHDILRIEFRNHGVVGEFQDPQNAWIVVATAALFISQNAPAILTCLEVRKFVRDLARAPNGCTYYIEQYRVIPVRLYRMRPTR